jgi:uncharacterized protein
MKYEELLKLARKAIKSHFDGEKLFVDEKIKKKFGEKLACFVTLTEGGELRGCIGTLSAHQELWKDVIENAIHAGFDDYRFSPLSKDELSKIKIEISVLSKPEKLEYKNPEDLLKKIDKKMGLILKKGWNSATFLPQVWEQLPDKVLFLEHLSSKAGLLKDAWKTAEFSFYRVESVEE